MSNNYSTVVLYRDDPDGLAPDAEELAAIKNSFPSTASRISTKIGKRTLVIPRYSFLPFGKELERDLEFRGARCINSYQEHRYIADLRNWYDDFEDITPQTWFRLEDAYSIKTPFRHYVLKGETNSKKFNWKTHMYAETFQDAVQVHSRLLEDSLIGCQDIYVREYIPLKTYLIAPQGLPITEEYRTFIYKGKILSTGFYWASHVEDIPNCPEQPDLEGKRFIEEVAGRLEDKTPFVVADTAKTEDGKWILIELNDGMMSGLSCNDPNVLYSNLAKELEDANL